MISVRKWVKDNSTSYNDREKFIIDAMNKFDCRRKTIVDYLSELRIAGQIPLQTLRFDGNFSSKSFINIKTSAIMSQIDNLKSERLIIKDNDFRLFFGVCKKDWMEVTSNNIFDDYKIVLNSKSYKGLYWGAKEQLETIKKEFGEY